VPTERRPLKIVFSMRHLGSFRMYELAVRLLASRGHRVHIMIDRGERLGWHEALEQVMGQCPTVTWGWSAPQHRTVWFEFSRMVRIWLDYLRYFSPVYAAAPILRRRAAERMPRALVRLTDRWPFDGDAGVRRLGRVLARVERAIPPARELDEAIAAERPDVMLFTPLVDLGSPQLDMLRRAHALRIRTALCVGSWDHLSSKALIRDVPHRVFVWNDTQRREAIDLHGLPADRVVVTGAQCYDQWFDRHPSRSREAFCARVGLPADRPFILWTCSALFQGSPSEPEFVLKWIESLRESGIRALREAGVLVRPHPARRHEWDAVGIGQFRDVVLYGAMPADEDARNDYFDSLYFSAAVAGLNTSAFLEAAIVGRPVHVILPPQFHDNQEGTIHFDYLRTAGGGLVHEARDFAGHHRQLLDSLEGRIDGARPSFLQAFVRPHGLDLPASDVFADSVESLGNAPSPMPVRSPVWLHLIRAAALPAAVATRLVLRWLPTGADKTSREILGARITEERARARAEKRRRTEEAARLLQQQRDREKAASVAARLAKKDQRRQERDRLVAENHRRKIELAERRKREKRRLNRRKRLDVLRERIMHRLGRA
jgi:hypothetical protein